MAKHRIHSQEFERQVAQEFLAGETLHGLAKRYDLSRNLVRIWVQKFEAGALDEDAVAADLVGQYEADSCPRTTGRQAGAGAGVSKGGSEQRTAAEKRAYTRDCRPFGAMKARMGATHFLTKTLPKVAAEMALSVLAYNLTRVMNIVGIKPLMAAIAA
jgi:transposase-like protein